MSVVRDRRRLLRRLVPAPLAVLAGAAFATFAPAAGAAVTGSFAATGNLNTARADAVAVRLSSGNVLVAGGDGAGGAPLSSTEIYDPTTGVWTTAAPMPVAVGQAAGVLLPDGDVLVVGGLTSSSGTPSVTGAAELYDPTTGQWSSTAPLASSAASYGASAVVLPASGDVLYVGGTDGTGSSQATVDLSQLYNPATGAWTATVGQLPTGVANAAAAVLGNGNILLGGGSTQSAGSTARVSALSEIYQPTTGTWLTAPAMPVGVAYSVATVLGDGDVLVAGGESSPDGGATAASQLYDPSSGTWSTAGALPFSSFAATASLTSSGDVLYAGGLTDGSNDATADAALFDPTSGQWTSTASLPAAAGGATATVLGDGAVLVAGGEAGSSVTSASSLYTVQAPMAPPAFTSAATADIQTGISTSITISATGSPAPTLSESGTLPPGLSFSAGQGGTATISGTPTAGSATSYQVTIVATNGVGSPAVQQLLLQYTRQPAVTTKPLVPARVGTVLHWTVRANGVPLPSLTVTGTLPKGITFTAGTNGSAVFGGKPSAAAVGEHVVTLVATNGIGVPATQRLTIDVSPGPAVVGGAGYWYATSAGQLFTKGAATALAPAVPQHPSDVIAMAATPSRDGYWLATSFGGIFNYGDAAFYGSLAHEHLSSPVTAFAATPDGKGYYLVAAGGQVYGFGDARLYGSPASVHPAPVVAIGVTPGDAGYWVVTSKGNVFNYGNARWLGSTAHQSVPAVTAFAPTPNGNGYWIVTTKGNVYHYGGATFSGSLADSAVPPVIAFAPTLDGKGYWVVTAKGNVYNFGDATFFGSSAASPPASAVTAFAPQF